MTPSDRQEQEPQELARVRAILDEQDWKDMLPRLVRISLYLLRKNNAGVVSKSTCAGKTAEDYVMDAIMKERFKTASAMVSEL